MRGANSPHVLRNVFFGSIGDTSTLNRQRQEALTRPMRQDHRGFGGYVPVRSLRFKVEDRRRNHRPSQSPCAVALRLTPKQSLSSRALATKQSLSSRLLIGRGRTLATTLVRHRKDVNPQTLYRRRGFSEDPGSLTPISATRCMPPLFIHERTAFPARVAGLVVHFYHSLPLPRLPHAVLSFFGSQFLVSVWNEPPPEHRSSRKKGPGLPDFHTLSLFRLLHANFHSVLKLYGVSIGLGVLVLYADKSIRFNMDHSWPNRSQQ